jgi:pimeloyl-ACP methyl ester carboxylesterase
MVARQESKGTTEQCLVRVGSATIYAEISGAGQPLVLVHGLGGSTRWWARNVLALANSYRVYVVDLAGFGRSRRQRVALRDTAGLLVGWMDQLSLPRVSIVGHSMGGFISADLAARFPNRVDRLVLVDAAVLPLERPSLAQTCRMVWGLRHFPLTLLPVACTDALRAGPFTLISTLRALLAEDICLDLARIEAPTLILWGEHDATLPLSVGQRLHQALPHATFHIISGAGHQPMWTRPDVFNHEVSHFLAAVPPPGVV